jgi:hypothetical protein
VGDNTDQSDEPRAKSGPSLLEALTPGDDHDFEFEPPKAQLISRPANFDVC